MNTVGAASPVARPTYQNDLVNSMAYRTAFLSMMNQSKLSDPFATPAQSLADTSSDVQSQRSNALTGTSTGITSISEVVSYHSRSDQLQLEQSRSRTSMLLQGEHLTVEKRKNISQRLGAAAYIGDEVKVRELLQLGAKVDFQDDLQCTALLRAVRGNRAKVVEILLQAGASSDLTDTESNRPLDIALEQALSQGRLDVLEALLRNSVSPDTYSADGEPALIAIVKREPSSEAKVLRLLLQNGAQTGARNERGITALHVAIYQGKQAAFAELVSAGAPVDIADCGGATPLHVACFSRQCWAIKPLLHAGADPEAQSKYVVKPKFENKYANGTRSVLFFEPWTDLIAPGTQYTALHFAAAAGDMDIVCALLDGGAYVDSLCANGITPLFIAATVLSFHRSSDVKRKRVFELTIGELVNHGANVARIEKLCQQTGRNLEDGVWAYICRKPQICRNQERIQPAMTRTTGNQARHDSRSQEVQQRQKKRKSLFRISSK